MNEQKYSIIGIGELLWDIFPDGKQLGGAPSNFAFHTNNLGANTLIISSLGNDKEGEEIADILKKRKINHSINISDYPTGKVNVELNEGIPQYEIVKNVAWDFIELKSEAKSNLENADAVCFGSLAQRSEKSFETIQKALSYVKDSTLKVFDINLRQNYFNTEIIEKSLQLANVLKLNDEELDVLIELFNLQTAEDKACRELIKKYNLKYLALTKGSKGSKIFYMNNISEFPVPKIKVVDTVGAGDSFTAKMIIEILNKSPLSVIHKEATLYSAKVCMHKGATPNIG